MKSVQTKFTHWAVKTNGATVGKKDSNLFSLRCFSTTWVCAWAFAISFPAKNAHASDVFVSIETSSIDLGANLSDTSEGSDFLSDNDSFKVTKSTTVSESESDLDPFFENIVDEFPALIVHSPIVLTVRNVADNTPQKSKFNSGLPIKLPIKIEIINESQGEEVAELNYEVMQKSKQLFRSGFDRPNFLVDPRFVGSLFDRALNGANSRSATVDFSPEMDAEEWAKASLLNAQGVKGQEYEVTGLDPSKTYGFVDGHVKELVENRAMIGNRSIAKVQQKSVPNIAMSSTPAASVGSVKLVSAEQKILQVGKDQIAVADLALTSNRGQASQSSFFSEAFAQSSSMRGQVIVPLGVDPKSVVVKLAGTELQVQANEEGYFDLGSLPKGSKFELIVWDINGVLSRRVISHAALSLSEIEIRMESSQDMMALGEAFGQIQDVTSYGFCGIAKARSEAALIGGKVTSVSPDHIGVVRYFSDTGLPNASAVSLGTTGEFCFFNVTAKIFSFEVRLANGALRTFTVHAVPGFFDRHMIFDVESAVHRPINFFELVDGRRSFESTLADEILSFGDTSHRNWLRTGETTDWAPVRDVSLNTDFSYGFVSPKRTEIAEQQGETFEKTKLAQGSELVYLPLGQELQVIRLQTENESGLTVGKTLKGQSFILESKANLQSSINKDTAITSKFSKVGVDKVNHLNLFVEPYDFLDDALADSRFENLDSTLGTALVSLNLAVIGLDFKDVRIAAKDIGSGKAVGKFQLIPSENGMTNANPKVLRGLLSGLPAGQFSLVVSDAAGAVKWLDILRSEAGSFQIISVRD